jgi:transaldolase
VKLVISDAHEGIKASVTKIFSATWQRCRVHFMRNALAYAGKSGRRVVSAFVATAFAQETAEAAKAQWRSVADQLRPTVPKLATLMDDAEEDVLAYMTFPAQHRTKLHSTDEMDKSSPCKIVLWPLCAGDSVAKNGTPAARSVRPPFHSPAGLERPRTFSFGRVSHWATNCSYVCSARRATSIS